MKLPKTFQLAGTTWRVEETDGLSEMGHCDTEEAVIRISSKLPREIKESTFCHELVHAISDTMGLREHNERDIDAFGHLLHQFLTTRA